MKKLFAILLIVFLVFISVYFALGHIAYYHYLLILAAAFLYAFYVQPKL